MATCTSETKNAGVEGGEELVKQFASQLDLTGNKKKLDTMWNTVLNHGYGYSELGGSLASETYLVCKMDGEPKPIIKGNNIEKHAEMQLVDDLKQMKLLQKKVTVYINNSPCAKKLKDYLEENEGIHLTLYVTHLYNIRRRSCQFRVNALEKERHIYYCEEHEANYQGLKDLMSLGGNRCEIKAFTVDVWRELHEVMGLTTDDYQQRMKKYNTMIQDRTQDPKNKKNHDRSRKTEDINIKNDLNHLKENVDPWNGIRKIFLKS